MNIEKIDILCNQVIDVALVAKEANSVINNANLSSYPQKFADRVNSVVKYCYNLFMDVDKHSNECNNDLMVNLLNTLVKYKNSYNPASYGYRVMNSLFDIVKDTFVELNN